MSAPINDGGQAFAGGDYGDPGMSLRDWFAGQALVGMLQNYTTQKFGLGEQTCARGAYEFADAMLAARDNELEQCDQLRAEVQRWELAFQEQYARAEKAEADLAAERARLDWLQNVDPNSHQWSIICDHTDIRAAIAAAMQEGDK